MIYVSSIPYKSSMLTIKDIVDAVTASWVSRGNAGDGFHSSNGQDANSSVSSIVGFLDGDEGGSGDGRDQRRVVYYNDVGLGGTAIGVSLEGAVNNEEQDGAAGDVKELGTEEVAAKVANAKDSATAPPADPSVAAQAALVHSGIYDTDVANKSDGKDLKSSLEGGVDHHQPSKFVVNHSSGSNVSHDDHSASYMTGCFDSDVIGQRPAESHDDTVFGLGLEDAVDSEAQYEAYENAKKGGEAPTEVTTTRDSTCAPSADLNAAAPAAAPPAPKHCSWGVHDNDEAKTKSDSGHLETSLDGDSHQHPCSRLAFLSSDSNASHDNRFTSSIISSRHGNQPGSTSFLDDRAEQEALVEEGRDVKKHRHQEVEAKLKTPVNPNETTPNQRSPLLELSGVNYSQQLAVKDYIELQTPEQWQRFVNIMSRQPRFQLAAGSGVQSPSNLLVTTENTGSKNHRVQVPASVAGEDNSKDLLAMTSDLESPPETLKKMPLEGAPMPCGSVIDGMDDTSKDLPVSAPISIKVVNAKDLTPTPTANQNAAAPVVDPLTVHAIPPQGRVYQSATFFNGKGGQVSLEDTANEEAQVEEGGNAKKHEDRNASLAKIVNACQGFPTDLAVLTSARLASEDMRTESPALGQMKLKSPPEVMTEKPATQGPGSDSATDNMSKKWLTPGSNNLKSPEEIMEEGTSGEEVHRQGLLQIAAANHAASILACPLATTASATSSFTGNAAASTSSSSRASATEDAANNHSSSASYRPSDGTALVASRFSGPELILNDGRPSLPFGMLGTVLNVDNSVAAHQPGSDTITEPPKLELNNHDQEPPRPVGMIEAMFDSVISSVAQHPSNQGDGLDMMVDTGPHPPACMLDLQDSIQDENTDTGKKAAGYDNLKKTSLTSPQQVENDIDPAPFDFAELDDSSDAKKKPASRINEEKVADGQEALRSGDEDTVREPRVDEAEDRAQIRIGAGPAVITHRENDDNLQLDIEGFPNSQTGVTETAGDINPENNSMVSSPESDSIIHVPQAWAVTGSDDGNDETEVEVFLATPLEPFWKRREGKFAIAGFFAMLIGGAIVLGVAFSRNNSSPQVAAKVVTVALSSPPSESTTPTSQPTTNFPSLPPTTSPSASIAPTASPSDVPSPSPSSSPTECAHQITSQAQTIDLQVEDLSETPRMAVDGGNMVAVVRDRESSTTYTRFYTRINNEWTVIDTFPEKYDDFFYSVVALSGNTAFVGSSWANDRQGDVSVYEQNRFGDWMKVEDLYLRDAESSHFTPCSHFGRSLDIDEDLACITEHGGNNLFHRDGKNWTEFVMVDIILPICSIAGDTIAIAGQNLNGEYLLQLYKYDADSDGVVPLQEPISANNIRQMSLSDDDLVFSTWYDNDVYVYHQEQANHTFEFHQQIKISGPLKYNRFAHDKDMLVIVGGDHTHVFYKKNGPWEETITLDRSYDEYRLSGRNLLVANDTGAYSFDFEGCAQTMPTQTPSAAPSPSPSVNPSSSQWPSSSFSPSLSLSVSPSMSPSSSLSPTETCFFVKVSVLTDRLYQDTWWDISSIVAGNGTQGKNTVYDSSTIELQVGGEAYSATHIEASATDTSVVGALCDCGDGGIQCDCQGQICLIYRRGSFIWEQVDNCKDGGGLAAIVYDNVEWPLWTPGFYDIIIPAAFISQADGQYLVEHSLGEVVSMAASASLQFRDEALHSRRVCLPEGEYQFTIYDVSGNGICCMCGYGQYNVTSNGGLIAQGGDFGSEEMTRSFEPIPDKGL